MKKIALLLGLLVLCLLGYTGLVRKDYLTYQIKNPPGAEFVPNRCNERGLVAHWKFDEIHNGSTPDASGMGNTGEAGVPLNPLVRYRVDGPQVVPGRVGNAIDFQKSQWFVAENSACFASEEVSVMGWVWLESSMYVPTIAAKSAWPIDGWWLCTTSNPPQSTSRFLDLGIAWGSGVVHVESGYQLPLHEWHHVAVTMDNTRHEVQFFIDGKLFGQKHTNVHPWNVNFGHNLILGAYNTAGRWPWHGKLDDMRIYNRVASDAEIKSAYQQGM